MRKLNLKVLKFFRSQKAKAGVINFVYIKTKLLYDDTFRNAKWRWKR